MSFRKEAIDLLKLLSSFDEQTKYEKSVPLANVPAELVCMWFDDFYHLTEDFINDFSQDEINALSAFNAYYDERLAIILELDNDLSAFHKSTAWREVCGEAQKTLAKIMDV